MGAAADNAETCPPTAAGNVQFTNEPTSAEELRWRAELFTPRFCNFLAEFVSTFEDEICDVFVLQRHARRLTLFSGGFACLDFPEDSVARQDPHWRVKPLDENRLRTQYPLIDLGDVDASNVHQFAAAFSHASSLAGASGVQLDFDDGCCPSWQNVLRGHYLVKRYCDELPPKKEGGPLLRFRPRAWNMAEENVLVNGKTVLGPVLDIAIHLFHNGARLAHVDQYIYVYLSKLESRREARLWNAIFAYFERRLRLQPAAVKTIVLVECLCAAFEMEEILYEIRDRCLGLNFGIWDYAASFITRARSEPAPPPAAPAHAAAPNAIFDSAAASPSPSCPLFPDRTKISGNSPFLRAARDLLVAICHKRGALATTGMFAGVGPDATSACEAAKSGEGAAGADGALVYDPQHARAARNALLRASAAGAGGRAGGRLTDAQTALYALYQQRRGRRQLREQILDFAACERPENLFSCFVENLEVTFYFILHWLSAKGHFVFRGRVEDSATAEICRAQIWQQVRCAAVLRVDYDVHACLERAAVLQKVQDAALGHRRAAAVRVSANLVIRAVRVLAEHVRDVERAREPLASLAADLDRWRLACHTAERLVRDLVLSFESPLFITSWLQERGVLRSQERRATALTHQSRGCSRKLSSENGSSALNSVVSDQSAKEMRCVGVWRAAAPNCPSVLVLTDLPGAGTTGPGPAATDAGAVPAMLGIARVTLERSASLDAAAGSRKLLGATTTSTAPSPNQDSTSTDVTPEPLERAHSEDGRDRPRTPEANAKLIESMHEGPHEGPHASRDNCPSSRGVSGNGWEQRREDPASKCRPLIQLTWTPHPDAAASSQHVLRGKKLLAMYWPGFPSRGT